MYHLNRHELEQISLINGTCSSRTEYMEAVAKAIGVRTRDVRHGLKVMTGIILDEHTHLDITCRTTNGQMAIKSIEVYHCEKMESGAWYQEEDRFTWKKGQWSKAHWESEGRA